MLGVFVAFYLTPLAIVALNSLRSYQEIASTSVLGFPKEVHLDNVNAVAPGAVFTERQRRFWMMPEAQAQILALQCLPDPVQPTDLAELVLFLVSDASRMVTKQFFAVNAGSL